MKVCLLSPHYDDAVLSFGASAAALARRTDLTVVTIFGGPPPFGYRETANATERHRRWGCGSATEAIVMRSAEDRAACAVLGVKRLALDFPDALYRPAYADRGTIGQPEPEMGLTAAILAALPEAGLYVAPLGVGLHVDHLLTYAVSCLLRARGARVAVWEDLPYGLYDRAATARRLRKAGWSGLEIGVGATEADWSRKMRAVACYASQLPSIFRTVALPDLLTHHRTNDRPLEWLWTEKRRTDGDSVPLSVLRQDTATHP